MEKCQVNISQNHMDSSPPMGSPNWLVDLGVWVLVKAPSTKDLYQVIQAVIFLSPIVDGQKFAFEFGSRELTIPKKVTFAELPGIPRKMNGVWTLVGGFCNPWKTISQKLGIWNFPKGWQLKKILETTQNTIREVRFNWLSMIFQWGEVFGEPR